MIGEEPGAYVAQTDLGDDQGQRVDQGNVEDVEEEGDASEHGDAAGERATRTLKERD